MWVLGRIMAGVRRWMSAQPPPSLFKSSKLPKSNLSCRKPDLTIEPEREINPTSTEGVVRRLLEPSVDQEEEKEYERYVDQYQTLLTRRDSYIDEADLSLYRTNLQICEAASADEPVNRCR